MRERLELLVDLWIYGVPVVVMTWAVLRLTMRAPARLRYLLAIGGFVATLAVPVFAPSADDGVRRLSRRFGSARSAPPAQTKAAAEPPHSILAIADVMAAPVTIAWTAVAALLLFRDAVGHARLRRARRAMSEASAELKHALQWPADVPLLISNHAFTVGLFRPAVVLPAGLLDKTIARHELSHARWRDPLVFALLRAAAAVFWVSPVWLVLRWVRREREAAADAAALRGTSGEEESYVAALMRFSRVRPARELTSAMAASDLEYRARRILAPERGSAVALLALAGGVLLLATATPARLEADEPVAAVVRSRHVIVAMPAPVVTTKVIPAETPPPRRAKRKPPKREVVVSPDVHRHVDVDVHVHVE